MTFDEHFGRFSEWFDVLAVTHRLQGSEDLRSKMRAEYFDVLQSYPFDAVEQAYQTLRRKMKKWPVPADWLEALPPHGSVARLTPMTREQARENDEAEALGYEMAAICRCHGCVAANCLIPPRYVPRVDPHGQPYERRHPVRVGRTVLLGKWLHGAELRAWQESRAIYYGLKTKFDAELKARTMSTLTPEQRLERITHAARILAAEGGAA